MTTVETTNTCATCASWKSSASTEGECRRHAPQLVVFEIDESTKIESRFPTTKADDWCGDFQEK
jgi:hypothetical protein